MDLRLWIPVMVLPVFVLAANILVRKAFSLPQSAMPDLMLCFFIFDGLVSLQSHDFEALIRIEAVKPATMGVYFVLAFASLVLWFIAVAKVEVQLIAIYEQHKSLLNLKGVQLLFGSVLLATIVVGFSIAPFAYGAS
jgi:hypothetical protein